MMTSPKSRAEVAESDQWCLTPLFPSDASWQAAFTKLAPHPDHTPIWKELAACQGTLHLGAKEVLHTLQLLLSIDRELSRLYTFAHLKHDEEIGNTTYKAAYEKISHLCHRFAEESSWFQPELLGLEEAFVEKLLQDPLLAEYHFHLEKLVRLKPHTLPKEQEALLALSGQALQTASKTFSSLNNADFIFPSIQDGHGEEKPLSHASYALYLRSHDRTLRQHAFETYHKHYLRFENTLADLLNGQLQTHLLRARARKYSSCLEAALFANNIPVSVYTSLIEAVNQGKKDLQRYLQLKKRLLKVDTLRAFDLYVPLTDQVDIQMDFPQAVDLLITSVAPLGEEYQSILRKGLVQERWVDRYENRQKRSGAYSSGCYDSHPYILMNYKGLLRDVFTLAHEAGHSMHSFFSRRSQPYVYSDYSIFLAEVASTFNEKLLARHLLHTLHTKQEKIFLIHQILEDIRGTLFRQTMFAEFEMHLHRQIEQAIPLTPSLLKEQYLALNQSYFGDTVALDEHTAIEWARIPHFYYNFYVFQYATGISAALSLEEKVATGHTGAKEAYLLFLKDGCRHYPIETLRLAGIDMSSPAPVLQTLAIFRSLLAELEKLLTV